MRLMREIRFSLLPAGLGTASVTNSWAGWPGAAVVAPYLTLRAVVSGEVQQPTGYLCNVAVLDRWLRDRAIPALQQQYAEAGGAPLPAPGILAALWEHVKPGMPDAITLEELHLKTTPHLTFSAVTGVLPMIRMTQSFEFAASHRLHCPELSDDENRAAFGKCGNPSGHGHNYVLDVTIEGRPDPETGVIIELPRFEAVVNERVIGQLDHKHLNTDCQEFATRNPSVENITRVVWDKLDGAFPGCRLSAVRVWETPRTYAEYTGDEAATA